MCSTPYLDHTIERIAINAKMGSVLPHNHGEQVRFVFNFDATHLNESLYVLEVGTMLAISYANNIRVMGFTDDRGLRVEIGTFNLHANVDELFFIGTQLVALSPTGKIGVWNSMTQLWQYQVRLLIVLKAVQPSEMIHVSRNCIRSPRTILQEHFCCLVPSLAQSTTLICKSFP